MISVIDDFNIKACNTFGMNVATRRWVEYTSETDVWQFVDELERHKAKSIGEGSNLLFTGDYCGSLLHSAIFGIDMTIEHDDSVLLTAGSGMHFDDLIAQTCNARMGGLENLTDIPGQVGAAAVQNVGAYGVEAKDVIDSVRCIDTKRRRVAVIPVKDCDYGYRESLFKNEPDRFVVTAVTFRLPRHWQPKLDYGNLREKVDAFEATPLAIKEAVREIRASKLPPLPEVGSAGSFFKNPIVAAADYDRVVATSRRFFGDDVVVPHFILPDARVKIPAAWLIDRCGWKGKRLGNAGVWKSQPLILVNLGGATPHEIIQLEQNIIADVAKKFGIVLSPEVEHISGC